MTTVSEALTAEDARKVSGYVQIDYTISEEVPVYEAVQKFAAFNIGCLVTLDTSGTYGDCKLQTNRHRNP